MTDPADKTPPDSDLKETLDEVAEVARRPHDDAEERERRREGAREAERSPRRQGEGVHRGSH